MPLVKKKTEVQSTEEQPQLPPAKTDGNKATTVKSYDRTESIITQVICKYASQPILTFSTSLKEWREKLWDEVDIQIKEYRKRGLL